MSPLARAPGHLTPTQTGGLASRSLARESGGAPISGLRPLVVFSPSSTGRCWPIPARRAQQSFNS